MRKPSFAAAAAALLLAAAPASAQGFERLGNALLAEMETSMSEHGFEPVEEPIWGTLDDGASEDIEQQVYRGLELVFVGVCDNECVDLDLALIDENGEEVVADALADDAPMIRFNPTRDGIYRLRVTMSGCVMPSCEYVVQTFW